MAEKNIEEKQKAELEKLQQDYDVTEIIDLEDLLLEGIEAKVPILIDFPMPDGTSKKVGAMIRPLTASEWNTCSLKLARQQKSMAEEVVKIGLLDKEGNPMPKRLIEQLPTGVTTEIYDEIAKISGVKEDKEGQLELVKEMMGF